MLIRKALATLTIAGAASLAVLVPSTAQASTAQAAAPAQARWSELWAYYQYSPLCEQAGANLQRQGRFNHWDCVYEGSKGWGLYYT
jgi:hypothetical protein